MLCHLHSTDIPEFCAGPATGGSARVSMTAAVSELEQGEEEEEATTPPGGRRDIGSKPLITGVTL